MVEEIASVFNRLNESKELKDFREKYPEAYLASFSLVGEKPDSAEWQINYYNPESNKMTSFTMGSVISVTPEQEILKAGEINKLEISEVKISFERSMAAAKEKFLENNTEPVQNNIIILQNSEKLKWHITFVTSSLKVVSYDIDAINGKILEEKSGSLVKKIS